MPRVNRNDVTSIAKDTKTQRALEEVLNGAVVAGPVEAGAQTPTLGAAMPGSVSGPPVWVPVTHEGNEYLLALWPRNP